MLSGRIWKSGLISLFALASVFSQGDTYKVRPGDNAQKIAKKFHMTVGHLMAANGLHGNQILHLGQRLSIPGGSGSSDEERPTKHHKSSRSSSSSDSGTPSHGVYHIVRGDTDWTIASKLGITIKSLHRSNPNVNWDNLHIGHKVHFTLASSSHGTSSRRIRTRYAVIAADGVTLRREPSTNSEKVTVVDAGTIAHVLDHEGKWYKLRFPKGTEAWVRADLLNPVKHHRSERVYASSHHRRRRRHTAEPAVAMNEVKGNKILSTAFSYRGTRYVTGGTSRSGGFDCSGLTTTVFKKNGIHLPRTAREQSGVGKRVGMDNLRKGDLVFFRTNRGVRVNHVGIYVGAGKFIHASSGGGRVQVSSLNEGYYNRRFAGGRRVAGAGSKKKHSKKSSD